MMVDKDELRKLIEDIDGEGAEYALERWGFREDEGEYARLAIEAQILIGIADKAVAAFMKELDKWR